MNTKIIFMGVIFSLLVLPSAFGFTHHAIGDWWEDLTNQIDEELERSRIGRELNRIIEDVGKVAEIASHVPGGGSPFEDHHDSNPPAGGSPK